MSCSARYGISRIEVINCLQQLARTPGPSGTLVTCGSQLQSHTYSCHFIHTLWELLPQLSPHLLYSNSHPAHPEPGRRSTFLSFHVSLKSNICSGHNWYNGNAELAHWQARTEVTWSDLTHALQGEMERSCWTPLPAVTCSINIPQHIIQPSLMRDISHSHQPPQLHLRP